MNWRPAILILFVSILGSQPADRNRAGKLPDGSFLLPTGWRLKPVGKQIPLDTLPMSSALSRDGKYLLVLNGGYRPPSISVLETGEMKELARVPVADGWEPRIEAKRIRTAGRQFMRCDCSRDKLSLSYLRTS